MANIFLAKSFRVNGPNPTVNTAHRVIADNLSNYQLIPGTTTVQPFGTNIGDVIKLCKVETGLTLCDAIVQVAAMDTGATLTCKLQANDGTTPFVWINTSTTYRAGGLIRPSAAPATEPAVGLTIPFPATTSTFYWLELVVVAAAAGVPAAAVMNFVFEFSGYYEPGTIKR